MNRSPRTMSARRRKRPLGQLQLEIPRVEPRVSEVDDPVLAIGALDLDLIRAQIDAQAVAKVVVVEEVALDDIATIAERDDELLESSRGVAPHDVPQNRPSADFDHGLGLRL